MYKVVNFLFITFLYFIVRTDDIVRPLDIYKTSEVRDKELLR